MTISLIIPIHNLEQNIGKCLQSIIRQRYDKSQYEIIVVLDSCTDGSEEIVKANLENCGIAHTILHTAYKSAGLSRNKGLEAARGKYIYFVDGDDHLTDLLALKRLTEIIESGDYNTVYMTKFESDVTVFDDDAIWRYFYTRDIIGDTRFTDATINEDWEFTKKIRSKLGYKEAKLYGVALYHYTFPREGSLTELYHKTQLNKQSL